MGKKIWFITGANRGIGAELAKAVLASGDKVVATGRDVQQLTDLYAAHGEQVLSLALDVTQEAQAAAAVEAALSRFGRIDMLVNNAGYGQLGLFEEVSSSDIERQFHTNVFGLMHVTRAVLPAMRRQRSGHILNLASVGGFLGFENASIYCATKFAVEGFSASLAPEVAPFGIKVTVVEPGFFRTDFLDQRSVRYGSQHIDDYAAASSASRATYDSYNHQQPGDPARLGQALVEIASMSTPPLHFVAGSDAVNFAVDTFDRRRREVDTHAALSRATDGQF